MVFAKLSVRVGQTASTLPVAWRAYKTLFFFWGPMFYFSYKISAVTWNADEQTKMSSRYWFATEYQKAHAAGDEKRIEELKKSIWWKKLLERSEH